MLTTPLSDELRANFANNHLITVCDTLCRRGGEPSLALVITGGDDLVRRKWRLNRVEYLITCTVSSSAR
jgi:hypothetical protein